MGQFIVEVIVFALVYSWGEHVGKTGKNVFGRKKYKYTWRCSESGCHFIAKGPNPVGLKDIALSHDLFHINKRT